MVRGQEKVPSLFEESSSLSTKPRVLHRRGALSCSCGGNNEGMGKKRGIPPGQLDMVLDGIMDSDLAVETDTILGVSIVHL